MSDEDMMYLKIYEVEREVLVAVCDCHLMGKSFAEGDLSFSVEASFFGEEQATPQEVKTALMNASIANIVGKNAVAWAVELSLVDYENVLHIEGIPCAQMVRM